MNDDFSSAGRISFFIRHRNMHWAADAGTYRFPVVRHAAISVDVVKQPGATLIVAVSGPFGASFEFREPVPPCDARGRVHVGLWWGERTLALFLNGEPRARRTALAH